MKRILVLAAIAALALPATVLAKGPSEASVSGPGLGEPLIVTGTEEPGTPLGDLAQSAGFFPAVFEQTPDPMLPGRPKGNLGPKYTIEYTVPGPDNDTFYIEQNVYPYAQPNAVSYMEPGQKIFEMPDGTRGGWYESYGLKDVLVEAGLPARPGAATAESSSFLSTGRLGALAAVLLAATGVGLAMRRRRSEPA